MSKKSLIMYASRTGHTEKVALRFKQVFEKYGWECDMLKIDKNTDVTQSPSPFDCDKIDFLCVGSYVDKSLPSDKVIDMMRNNPQSAHYNPMLENKDRPQLPEPPEWGPEMESDDRPEPPMQHRKLFLGPQNKKGIVFVTYAGHEFGPPEAVPALELLALEMEHLKFVCSGKFCCPGKFGNPKEAFFKDISKRPNERDLLKAEIFMEEVLETLD